MPLQLIGHCRHQQFDAIWTLYAWCFFLRCSRNAFSITNPPPPPTGKGKLGTDISYRRTISSGPDQSQPTNVSGGHEQRDIRVLGGAVPVTADHGSPEQLQPGHPGHIQQGSGLGQGAEHGGGRRAA